MKTIVLFLGFGLLSSVDFAQAGEFDFSAARRRHYTCQKKRPHNDYARDEFPGRVDLFLPLRGSPAGEKKWFFDGYLNLIYENPLKKSHDTQVIAEIGMLKNESTLTRVIQGKGQAIRMELDRSDVAVLTYNYGSATYHCQYTLPRHP